MDYGIVDRESNTNADGVGIGGGIGAMPGGEQGYVTVYIDVPDVEAALAKAESLGGTRLMGPEQPMEGLEIGLFADPERNPVGVVKGMYMFLNAGTIQPQQYQGRSYQVAFRDLEERGVSFDTTLLLNASDAAPRTPGEAMFKSLRDIANAPLSYVAVKDRDGGLWYASVALTEGERVEPYHHYTADITVLQTTDTPSIVSV